MAGVAKDYGGSVFKFVTLRKAMYIYCFWVNVNALQKIIWGWLCFGHHLGLFWGCFGHHLGKLLASFGDVLGSSMHMSTLRCHRWPWHTFQRFSLHLDLDCRWIWTSCGVDLDFDDLLVWIGIFFGLGFATFGRHTATYICQQWVVRGGLDTLSQYFKRFSFLRWKIGTKNCWLR